MPDQTTTQPIPLERQATQVPPPPEGTVPAWLYKRFGPSYRTTLAAWSAAASGIAAFIQALCPHLLNFQWDAHEAKILFWAIVSAGGLAKFGIVAKDISATGVQK